jgi:CheY-like chemotaxis protein
VKFTPGHGAVGVSLSHVGKRVRIEVTDTGIGLAPAFLPHIFDRFRQADSSPGREYMGLGLGLSLARHLTELHGGTIVAHSDGLGQGATLVVDLPLVAAPNGDAVGAIEADTPRLDHVRVLVVDDDADGVEMAAAVLREVGAAVVTSGTVREAIDHVRHSRVDIIVSDIAMPDEDGYSLIRQVRQDLASDIPAIALTARVRREDRSEALAAGFQLHVSKPVMPVDLVSAVASVLSPLE